MSFRDGDPDLIQIPIFQSEILGTKIKSDTDDQDPDHIPGFKDISANIDAGNVKFGGNMYFHKSEERIRRENPTNLNICTSNLENSGFWAFF